MGSDKTTRDEHAYRMAGCGHCGEHLPDVEREIERLRIALVNAAVPLEAINMTTTFKMLSPEMQDGIHMALTSIRDALGVNADAE